MPQLSADNAGLELGEHPHFERHWRTIQTIVFSLMGLMVVAGLAGLFGTGPVATGRAGFPDTGSSVEYQRFASSRAPISLTLKPGAASGGHVALHLDRPLANALQLEKAWPAPLASAAGQSGVTYLFAVEPGGNAAVELRGKTGKPGLVRGTIAVDGSAQSITQLVWP